MPLFADIADPMELVLLVPLIAGALAIWYLLPTPSRRPAAPGFLIGLLALGGLGAFLLKGFGQEIPNPTTLSANQIVEAVLFFGFAGMAIIFALLMIVSRKPERSALSFAMVVLSVCGIFLLQAAPFLMATTIIVYAGAIVVTFLFVIMLSQRSTASNADERTREPALSVAAAFILLATFLVGLQRVYNTASIDAVIVEAQRIAQAEKLDVLYQSAAKPDLVLQDREVKISSKAKKFVEDCRAALKRVEVAEPRSKDDSRLTENKTVREVENAISALELMGFVFNDTNEVRESCVKIASGLTLLKQQREIAAKPADVVRSPYGEVLPVTGAESAPRKLPAANVSAIGRTVFTDHLLAVELVGTLLLIATVGAIAIAARTREKNEVKRA